jgi:hypothetical protein
LESKKSAAFHSACGRVPFHLFVGTAADQTCSDRVICGGRMAGIDAGPAAKASAGKAVAGKVYTKS